MSAYPDWLSRDSATVWHPYSTPQASPFFEVTGAQGVRLEVRDRSGQSTELIDAMSSWWSAIHGYGHPALVAAMHTQIDRFSHVMFGGLTHEPALRLAEHLLAVLPGPMSRIFFADSGSVSVEVALKAAVQVAQGRGRPSATTVLSFRGGYHGDTLGAMSVTDPDGGLHAAFGGVMPRHLFGPRPPAAAARGVIHTPHAPVPEAVSRWAAEVRELAHKQPDALCAIIIEPVVQGAGGMHIYPAQCLQVLRDLADELDCVLIFDEIATGFGRTGPLFAAHWAGVTPDMVCVGKALTGGMVTLAAMACTDVVARAVSASGSGVLMHGPTFMANPLACAVASASVELCTAPDFSERAQRIQQSLAAELEPLQDDPRVVRVSVLGGLGCVQLGTAIDVHAATLAAAQHGVWIRPFRDMIYAMPPFVASVADLRQVGVALRAAVASQPAPAPRTHLGGQHGGRTIIRTVV